MHKKAALLRENFRADFVAWLDRQETLEQIAQIADDRGQVAAQHRHLQNEFKRQMYLLNVRDRNLARLLGLRKHAAQPAWLIYAVQPIQSASARSEILAWVD